MRKIWFYIAARLEYINIENQASRYEFLILKKDEKCKFFNIFNLKRKQYLCKIHNIKITIQYKHNIFTINKYIIYIFLVFMTKFIVSLL